MHITHQQYTALQGCRRRWPWGFLAGSQQNDDQCVVYFVLQELQSALLSQGLSAFDLVFIDHEKSVYLSDLQLLIKAGLIRWGQIMLWSQIKCVNH